MSSVVKRKPSEFTEEEKEKVDQRQRAQEAFRKRTSKKKTSSTAYYVSIGVVTALILGAIAMIVMSPDRGLASTYVLEEDNIQTINDRSYTWKAGQNSFFEGWSLADAKGIMGASVSSMGRLLPACQSTLATDVTIPESFDVREAYPDCMEPIAAQGNCSSAWALATVSSLGERFCIQSKGQIKPHLSAQEPLSCDNRNFGCRGGYIDTAWEYIEALGVVTNDCFPYAANSSITCDQKCSEPKPYHAKAHCSASGEAAIQKEILANGPVVAPMLVYTDLLVYTQGVYKHLPTSSRFSAAHAVKIVGWGVEKEMNLKYWIVANTWGNDWGLNGYAKVLRGENECGLEDFTVAGVPSLEQVEMESEEEGEQDEEEVTAEDDKKSKFQRGKKKLE